MLIGTGPQALCTYSYTHTQVGQYTEAGLSAGNRATDLQKVASTNFKQNATWKTLSLRTAASLVRVWCLHLCVCVCAQICVILCACLHAAVRRPAGLGCLMVLACVMCAFGRMESSSSKVCKVCKNTVGLGITMPW